MKQNFLVVALTLITACIKTGSGEQEEKTSILKAKEYLTGEPLSGVSIQLYKCYDRDIFGNCMSSLLVATYYTDAKGESKVKDADLDKANDGVIYKKYQYWDTKVGEAMEPEAAVDVSVKAGKEYPDTLELRLSTRGATGIGSAIKFKPPKDSVVNFKIFGNEENNIDWVLYPKSKLDFCVFFCDVVDTVASGSFTVRPKKFETVKASIVY